VNLAKVNSPNEYSVKWIFQFAGVVIVEVVLGKYYLLVFCPISAQRKEHDRRIAEFTEVLKQSGEVQQRHESLRKELAELRSSVKFTHRRLVTNLREEDFLDEVRTIAENLDFELKDYRLGSKESMTKYSKAEISLQCSGSFAGICRFLYEIDQLSRITEISSLELESSTNFGGYPFQVSFVLYFGATSNDRSMKERVL